MRRVLSIVAVAALLGGCSGLGSDDEVPGRVNGPTLVTREQLDELPAGSPERVVFEWWRALQYDNAIGAVRYYARDAGMTVETLDKDLSLGAAGLGLTARPKLVETEENGDEATVYVLLEQQEPQENGRVDTRQTARAFNLVREDGEWKLAENRYLARAVRVQRIFSALARKQAQRAQQKQQSTP